MDIHKILTILQEAANQYTARTLDTSLVIQKILSLAYNNDWTGNHLQHFCQIFYAWTLETKTHVEVSVVLTDGIIDLEIDGQKFRTPWFHLLQSDFQNVAVMRVANKQRWLNFASYLCKILVNLKIGDAPVMVLLQPSCTCMEILLTSQDASNEEIECGVKQLVNCGPLLMKYYHETLQQLMAKVRHKILAHDTPLVGQTFLLEVLEMYSGGWSLKESSKDYYKNRLFEIQVPVKELHLD